MPPLVKSLSRACFLAYWSFFTLLTLDQIAQSPSSLTLIGGNAGTQTGRGPVEPFSGTSIICTYNTYVPVHSRHGVEKSSPTGDSSPQPRMKPQCRRHRQGGGTTEGTQHTQKQRQITYLWLLSPSLLDIHRWETVVGRLEGETKKSWFCHRWAVPHMYKFWPLSFPWENILPFNDYLLCISLPSLFWCRRCLGGDDVVSSNKRGFSGEVSRSLDRFLCIKNEHPSLRWVSSNI